jgi:hypothetical protein
MYILCLFLALSVSLFSTPHPIQFSIPESKVVNEIPEKTRDFATVIPGRLETYIFIMEQDYYKDYQNSFYAITTKKAGWDCMRHYEILANGCIPYFVDLDSCDAHTMAFLPRDLIKEAMNLTGVSYMHIDHSQFDRNRYFEILEELLDHTRRYLTTRKMAAYVLDTMQYSGKGEILFLSWDPQPDYLRCLTLAGLKEIARDKVIDFPRINHIYKDYLGNITSLYGKGISYTRNVDDYSINRENIEQRILNKEFELIIYGSVHRGMPFHHLVINTYPQSKIGYICGEDYHHCEFSKFPNFFLREFEAYVP